MSLGKTDLSQRDKARSLAHYQRRKGKLKPEPCEVCASNQVQMHHDDYAKPLDVRWLCYLHHRELHHGPSNELRYWPPRNGYQKSADPLRQVPVGDACMQLRLTAQQVITRIQTGVLEGGRLNGKWFVIARSFEQYIVEGPLELSDSEPAA